MNDKLRVAVGKLYRGEIIWKVACGQAVVFPSWLGGRAQINFISLGEAQAFVMAYCLCHQFVEVGGARVEAMPTVYAEAAA